MSSIKIRPARPADLADFYAISLVTGHQGGDASAIYDDPELMGHIYSAPYLKHAAAGCFVGQDRRGVLGYVVAVADTADFAMRLERDWWPALRLRYPQPDPQDRAHWNPDQQRAAMIHHPHLPPKAVLEKYPGHLHLNVLARARGLGLGTKLLQHCLQQLGADGVHVGVNPQNPRGVAFWQGKGFEPIAGVDDTRTIWLGRDAD